MASILLRKRQSYLKRPDTYIRPMRTQNVPSEALFNGHGQQLLFKVCFNVIYRPSNYHLSICSWILWQGWRCTDRLEYTELVLSTKYKLGLFLILTSGGSTIWNSWATLLAAATIRELVIFKNLYILSLYCISFIQLSTRLNNFFSLIYSAGRDLWIITGNESTIRKVVKCLIHILYQQKQKIMSDYSKSITVWIKKLDFFTILTTNPYRSL